MKLMDLFGNKSGVRARTAICYILAIYYLLVSSSMNLFHTEYAGRRHIINDKFPELNGTSYNSDYPVEHNKNFSNSTYENWSIYIAGDFCPVCAFLKTYENQFSPPLILSFYTWTQIHRIKPARAGLPVNHTLSGLQSRAPPAFLFTC